MWPSPNSELKVVIVGGGIAGSFSAYYLLKSGHDVVIIDSGREQRVRTSIYNSGILSSAAPYTPLFSGWVRISDGERRRHRRWFSLARRIEGEDYDSRVARVVPRSVTLYREFLRGIETEINLKLDDLTLYSRPGESEEHVRKFGGKVLGSRELRDVGYRWAGSGVLGPDLSAHTGKLMQVLRDRVSDLGGERLEGVARLKASSARGGTRILGALTRGNGLVTGDEYVLTAGSWIGPLCVPLRFDPMVLPARGMAQFCETGGETLVDYPATFPEFTVTQHDPGTVRLTSFFDLVGFKPRFPKADAQWLFLSARDSLVRPNKMRLREVGVGLRPSTPDQLPVVGAIPGCANGLVASGGTRKGITLAPLMGHLISQSVASLAGASPSREDRDSLQALSPGRFQP